MSSFSASEPQYFDVLRNTDGKVLRQAWEVGAGLQAIDGFTPSKQAYELAESVIDGKATYFEVEQNLLSKYENKHTERDQIEADISALRIAEIISTASLAPYPSALKAIHKKIFDGILEEAEWAGEWRKITIGKPEPAIQGRTITYDAPFQIEDSLNTIFAKEQFLPIYPDMPDSELVNQVMRFISKIWKVHPFREGNTRTVATYAILYLKHLGIDISNEPFANNAQYFRDALVLDNAPYRMSDKVPLMAFGASLLDADIELPKLRT